MKLVRTKAAVCTAAVTLVSAPTAMFALWLNGVGSPDVPRFGVAVMSYLVGSWLIYVGQCIETKRAA